MCASLYWWILLKCKKVSVILNGRWNILQHRFIASAARSCDYCIPKGRGFGDYLLPFVNILKSFSRLFLIFCSFRPSYLRNFQLVSLAFAYKFFSITLLALSRCRSHSVSTGQVIFSREGMWIAVYMRPASKIAVTKIAIIFSWRPHLSKHVTPILLCISNELL